MKYFLVFITAVICFSCAGTTLKSVTAVSESAEDEIEKGRDIEVRLHGNTSTGYGWTLKSSPKILKLKSGPDIKREKTGTIIAGAPDVTVFIFTAISSGEEEIVFENYRPWEKNSKPFKYFTLKIKVK